MSTACNTQVWLWLTAHWTSGRRSGGAGFFVGVDSSGKWSSRKLGTLCSHFFFPMTEEMDRWWTTINRSKHITNASQYVVKMVFLLEAKKSTYHHEGPLGLITLLCSSHFYSSEGLPKSTPTSNFQIYICSIVDSEKKYPTSNFQIDICSMVRKNTTCNFQIYVCSMVDSDKKNPTSNFQIDICSMATVIKIQLPNLHMFKGDTDNKIQLPTSNFQIDIRSMVRKNYNLQLPNPHMLNGETQSLVNE